MIPAFQVSAVITRWLRTGGTKGERRSEGHKRLLYCVNVNYTSLDHLLLGENADVDKMSSEPSIAREQAAGTSVFARVGNHSSNPLKLTSMICPNCGKAMTDWMLEGQLGKQFTIDVCTACQAFWFGPHEDLQLSPGSTLKLMKYIGEHTSSAKATMSETMRCPRCGGGLSLAHDMVHATRFTYWNCESGHGRLIGFFDFLKEKNFIRALSPQEIQQLKMNVQSVNCSNCGASIDLQTNSACPYCHAAISILDMKQ